MLNERSVGLLSTYHVGFNGNYDFTDRILATLARTQGPAGAQAEGTSLAASRRVTWTGRWVGLRHHTPSWKGRWRSEEQEPRAGPSGGQGGCSLQSGLTMCRGELLLGSSPTGVGDGEWRVGDSGSACQTLWGAPVPRLYIHRAGNVYFSLLTFSK